MSSEAPKSMGKEELIAKLSKMRDGLNAVAAERQSMAEAEENLRKLQALTEQEKEVHSEAVRQVTAKKENIESRVKLLEKKAEELSDERSDASWTSPKHYAKANKGLLIASIIVGVYMFALLASLLGMGDVPVFPVIFGSVIMGAILPIITAVNRNKRGTRRRDEVIQEIAARMVENQKELDQMKGELTKVTRDLQELSANPPTDDELQACIKMVEEEIKPNCLAKIAAAEKIISDNAEGILEKEDWRNASMLVYYLKTGRADSLKEALLMMVEQNRNEDLISSIRSAAYSITSAVSRMSGSMQAFGSQINDAYRETARRFDQSYADMQYAMEDMSRSVSAQLSNLNSTIESQGRAIAEAERRNADLLAHANQNSDELMYQITYNS